MTRTQRNKDYKNKKRDILKKNGRWSGKRKFRSSKIDKHKSKSEREWSY